MAKQTQGKEAKANKKNQPAVEPGVATEQALAMDSLNAPLADPAGTGEAHAAPLKDPRLDAIQRQAIADQIGQAHGNQHLQRLISSLGQGTSTGVQPGSNGHGSGAAAGKG